MMAGRSTTLVFVHFTMVALRTSARRPGSVYTLARCSMACLAAGILSPQLCLQPPLFCLCWGVIGCCCCAAQLLFLRYRTAVAIFCHCRLLQLQVPGVVIIHHHTVAPQFTLRWLLSSSLPSTGPPHLAITNITTTILSILNSIEFNGLSQKHCQQQRKEQTHQKHQQQQSRHQHHPTSHCSATHDCDLSIVKRCLLKRAPLLLLLAYGFASNCISCTPEPTSLPGQGRLDRAPLDLPYALTPLDELQRCDGLR